MSRELERLQHSFDRAIELSKEQIQALQVKNDDLQGDNVACLKLLADIRFALGDNGKRMQAELVEYCAELRKDKERLDYADELHPHWYFNGHKEPFEGTLRAAIDAAMKDEEK